MADAVYAIEDFPDDDLLWRIEWIGGVGYNTSVPSDPQIEICLAQLPAGETNPLSARSRSSQTKRTVRIAVGLLPYISIASVWQQRRLVNKGPRCQPPSAVHRHVIVSNGGVGGTGKCYSQKQLPFRCALAWCPPNPPGGGGAER